MNTERFKFRVWMKGWKEYDNSGVYLSPDAELLYPEDDGGECGASMYPIDSNYLIEQCTGLRDKNGKLIYEGDVIECCYGDKGKESRYKYVVLWNKEERRLMKYSISDFEWLKKEHPTVSNERLLEFANYGGIKDEFAYIREIVGNIHEPKWGLEK